MMEEPQLSAVMTYHRIFSCPRFFSKQQTITGNDRMANQDQPEQNEGGGGGERTQDV